MAGIIGLLVYSESFDEVSSTQKIFLRMADKLSHRGSLIEFQYDLKYGRVHLGVFSTDNTLDYIENHRQFKLLVIDTFGIRDISTLDRVADSICDVKNQHGSNQMLVGIGLSEEGDLRIHRSLDGVRPLYFTKLEYGWAFSTEQKAIWEVYPTKPQVLSPGCTLSIAGEKQGILQSQFRSLPETVTKRSYESHLNNLERTLRFTFSKLEGIGKCGILFSGGVDSSLAALLANNICEETVLISAATPDSKDFIKTTRAASDLSLEHKLIQLDAVDIWDLLPEVIYATETSNRMDIEIATPFFTAAKHAKEIGCKVLVSGQGPDEIFAGYARYEKEYIESGIEKLREQLWSDYSITHEANIARDVKAIEYHTLDSFFPYLDFEFVKIAFSTPIEWLLDPMSSPSRKILFRKLAKKMGLPDNLADVQKHATQFSSGSSKVLREAVVNHVMNAKRLSKKEISKIVQDVLHTIAQEIGIPIKHQLDTNLNIDMKATFRLIERVGRLPTSNLW